MKVESGSFPAVSRLTGAIRAVFASNMVKLGVSEFESGSNLANICRHKAALCFQDGKIAIRKPIVCCPYCNRAAESYRLAAHPDL
jgi:hypothetical protein